ncbi:MAG: toxin-antitoxin system protein [Actinomycetota bacterium]
MATTTIRVEMETRDRLNELARRRRVPASRIVDELVREADDRALLESASEAWQRMADSDAVAGYRAEADDLSAFHTRLPDE